MFARISMQLITACKRDILAVQGEETGNRIWEKDPKQLIPRLEVCLQLNQSYQEQYRITRDRSDAAGQTKRFEFNERALFGKFDLFCRRIVKLIDMFATIDQVRRTPRLLRHISVLWRLSCCLLCCIVLC